MKTLYLLLPLICLIQSCIRMPQQYNIISPGIWRASLVLNDSREVIVTRSIDKVVTRDANPESTKTLIPFNFEVIYRNDSSFYIEVINGPERIRFDSITYGRNIKTGNDTMVIYLRPYASVIRCIYENNKMAGEFIILDKVNYSIPFEASYGQAYRFLKIPEKATCRSTVHGMRFLLKILLISLMQSESFSKMDKKSRVLLEQKLVIFAI